MCVAYIAFWLMTLVLVDFDVVALVDRHAVFVNDDRLEESCIRHGGCL